MYRLRCILMEGRREARWVGALGVASFVAIIGAALVAPPLWEAPSSGASPAAIAAYVTGERGRLLASLPVYAVGLGLFLCFTAGLASLLRPAEPAPAMRTAAFAFGAVTLTALILAAFGLGAVNAYRPQPPALARALYDLTFAVLAVSGIPTAVCLGAYANLVSRSECLPAWTAWLAVLGALAHLLIVGSTLFRGGFLSLEGGVVVAVPATFFAWILLTGLVLLSPPASPAGDI
jgi:hypothetical protein